MHQFGRTVSLGITAFMLPLSGTETLKFSKIDTEEQAFIKAIEASGFVSDITINGKIIKVVKILSYEFVTAEASLNDHIQLLRANMSLEFTEKIDNKAMLTKADPLVYPDTDFLNNAQYFDSFSERFNFSISQKYQYNFNHSVEFSLKKNSETGVDFVAIAKQMALGIFNAAAPQVGYIDNRYKDFIRTVQGNGTFSESYDSINNRYSITRTMDAKNGLYKTNQKGKNWSAEVSHQAAVNEVGDVVITESGVIQGKNVTVLNPVEIADKKGDDTYENAFQGFLIMKDGAYDRCQDIFDDFVTDTPDWVPSTMRWDTATDLKTKTVAFGKSLNRIGGSISYTMTFTNNPRMHKDAIFEYTLQSSRSDDNISSITEEGSIRPYDTSKARFLWDKEDLKGLYDGFTRSSDVLDRIEPLFESVKKSDVTLSHPTHLISSSLSFNVYGKAISYNFRYSDDPTLRNETYIRRLASNEQETMPVAIRDSVLAPNIKQTNYDSNQSTEGTKAVGMNVVFKRNPNSNLINKDHTDYLKAASDSVVVTLKEKLRSRAFVNSPQVGKDELSWFLESFQYSFNSDYTFDFDADMVFIDKKGVASTALEY